MKTLAEAGALHDRVRRGDVQPVVQAAAAIVRSLKQGGKLLIFGNGGSAADAQHTAADLVGRFQRERPALAAIALSADTSVLTAVGNDAPERRIPAVPEPPRPGGLDDSVWYRPRALEGPGG